MSALHDALFAALAAVAPICNLDTPDEADRTTWRCGFLDSATDGQRAAAAEVLASFSPATSPPAATGNQWAFALSDLGLASAWLAGLAKSKASDQVRYGLIARDTSLVASDPLLVRIAANAGSDGAGALLVDVPTVHAHARGMPL